MLNHRVFTFLTLCEVMNYRKTAEELNMTQPAVTQHIHFLEERYQCKLFEYNNRVLLKTQRGEELERYARSVLANDLSFKEYLNTDVINRISIGFTKTIGDHAMEEKIYNLLSNDDIKLDIVVDNTQHLLERLNRLELDFAVVEGYFDKKDYGFKLLKTEELVGVCSKSHPFAGKVVVMDEIMREHVILREDGSGTRTVFEHYLQEFGYKSSDFKRTSIVSSMRLIEGAVKQDMGISFVYESILINNPDITTFKVKNLTMTHEFNYVFLKDTNAIELIERVMG